MAADVDAVSHDLERLRAQLASSDDPLVNELLDGMRTTMEELRAAEAELERQNNELAALQEALADEAARYRTLFEAAPIAYVATDTRGIILEANAATAKLLDVEERFLIRKPLPMFVDEPERHALRSYIADLVRTGGSSANLRFRFRRHGGVRFDTLVRATASARDIRWMLQDVTDERQSEQRLWELNAELESRVSTHAGEIAAVLEHLPVGVAIIDAATGVVRRANPRATEILGSAVDKDAAGRFDALERRRPDGAPLSRDEWPIVRALRGEVVADEVVMFPLPDGRRPIVQIDAVPMRDAAGRVTGVVMTFDDVTHREQRERAEREFVSNAAHQIRSPITAIASAVAVLQAGAKEKPDDRDRFLGHIEREVERLARLGEALLSLARTQRGEGQPNLTVVPLRPLLETLVLELRPYAGVTVEVECMEDVAALTHRPLLEEALANVLSNSVKYTHRGRVRVAARHVVERTVVTVEDTGPGISKEARPRALERFFRASGDAQGFGLGLAIAAQAVTAVGGTLDLDSTPDVGTTVTITLPGARLLP
jgi:PAS domain S-box-containing protein